MAGDAVLGVDPTVPVGKRCDGWGIGESLEQVQFLGFSFDFLWFYAVSFATITSLTIFLGWRWRCYDLTRLIFVFLAAVFCLIDGVTIYAQTNIPDDSCLFFFHEKENLVKRALGRFSAEGQAAALSAMHAATEEVDDQIKNTVYFFGVLIALTSFGVLRSLPLMDSQNRVVTFNSFQHGTLTLALFSAVAFAFFIFLCFDMIIRINVIQYVILSEGLPFHYEFGKSYLNALYWYLASAGVAASILAFSSMALPDPKKEDK